MAVQPVFPTYQSPARLLGPWLTSQLGVRVVTKTPASLASVVPLLKITGIGGSDFTPTFDTRNVDIDSYAANEGDSEDLANAVRRALMFILPGQILGTAVISQVRTIMSPIHDEHFLTDDLSRFIGSYAITFHS